MPRTPCLKGPVAAKAVAKHLSCIIIFEAKRGAHITFFLFLTVTAPLAGLAKAPVPALAGGGVLLGTGSAVFALLTKGENSKVRKVANPTGIIPQRHC